MGNRFSTAVLQRLGSCFSSRLLSLAATATFAAALMPAIASATLIVPDGTCQNFDTGGGSSTCTGLPGIVLTAQGGGGGNSQGFTFINYFYGVDGPQADVIVPMFATLILHTQASGPCTNVGGTIEAAGAVALFRLRGDTISIERCALIPVA
jgi:hypothetical protein